MSDDEGSGTGSGSGSSNGVTVTYKCRHCPGEVFSAAECDAHRRTHRRKRTGSPPLTLFSPISVANEPSGDSGSGIVIPRPRRRKSKKLYFTHVKKHKNNGG